VTADYHCQNDTPKGKQIMSLTLVLAMLSLFALVPVFGVTLAIKGLKTALITTAIASVIIAVLYLALIQVIVSLMPN
jgi:hypothetical protein